MLELSYRGLSLVIEPEHGGAILGWTRDGTHLLRRPTPAAVLLGTSGSMGCFPLVPFCNRIAFRRFEWAGKSYQLPANFGDSPHAIHGIGWQRAWQIERVSQDGATLSLRHDDGAPGWPFAFAAHLDYRLSELGLTIRIEAVNLHSGPAPMGIGAHPWWPRPAAAALTFQAAGVWMTRDDLPARHQPVPAAWDHTSGRLVDGERLDHCFTAWQREAELPAVRITADEVFGNLQVFTPPAVNFFCVEPMSHVPNAINLPDLPAAQSMTVLAHGQTLSGSMIFSPR